MSWYLSYAFFGVLQKVKTINYMYMRQKPGFQSDHFSSFLGKMTILIEIDNHNTPRDRFYGTKGTPKTKSDATERGV